MIALLRHARSRGIAPGEAAYVLARGRGAPQMPPLLRAGKLRPLLGSLTARVCASEFGADAAVLDFCFPHLAGLRLKTHLGQLLGFFTEDFLARHDPLVVRHSGPRIDDVHARRRELYLALSRAAAVCG